MTCMSGGMRQQYCTPTFAKTGKTLSRCLPNSAFARATSSLAEAGEVRSQPQLIVHSPSADGVNENSLRRFGLIKNVYNSPTHKVDCFKNGIGPELEWN